MFIEEFLVELRRERFSLPALVRYAHRVGQRVRADWLANPNAVRSVWAVAIVYFAVVFLACVGMALAWDRELAERFLVQTALWMLPAFAFVMLALFEATSFIHGWIRLSRLLLILALFPYLTRL